MENIPPGFCQCGCGQRTSIVTQADPKRGYKKGDYKRFVRFHNSNKNHLIPKICVICGTEFLPQKRSRQETQKTCSAKCRNAHIARRSAIRFSEERVSSGGGKAYRKYHGAHEHRIVMEGLLGRPLSSSEIVHHKDENILNNAPDNLELTNRSDHARLHFHILPKLRQEGSDSVDRVLVGSATSN